VRALRVSLEYTDDAIHPVHAFVCESPHVEREVLLHETVANGVTTMLLYVEGDLEAYESILASVPSIEEYSTAREGDDAFHLYVRERLREEETRLAAAFERETVLVVPPVEFRADRTMRLWLVGRSDDLQAVLDDLPGAVTVDVLEVGTYTRAVGGVLTDRQREAVEVASGVGYYEVPRTGGIEDVASALGCAVSTASELLRRAEARLVADALRRGP
jgi:predicted DNA binding protein